MRHPIRHEFQGMGGTDAEMKVKLVRAAAPLELLVYLRYSRATGRIFPRPRLETRQTIQEMGFHSCLVTSGQLG